MAPTLPGNIYWKHIYLCLPANCPVLSNICQIISKRLSLFCWLFAIYCIKSTSVAIFTNSNNLILADWLVSVAYISSLLLGVWNQVCLYVWSIKYHVDYTIWVEKHSIALSKPGWRGGFLLNYIIWNYLKKVIPRII